MYAPHGRSEKELWEEIDKIISGSVTISSESLMLSVKRRSVRVVRLTSVRQTTSITSFTGMNCKKSAWGLGGTLNQFLLSRDFIAE